MKHFALIFRGGNAPENEKDEEWRKWDEWTKRLKNGNVYINGEALGKSGKIVNANGRDITDISDNDSNEKITGYCVIKAETINEAITLTDDCPIYKYNGAIEVRGIVEM